MRRHALLALLLTAYGLGAAAGEPAATMQSAAERAAETPAGAWQGNWIVLRDDARIRTRAGAEVLRLQVIQDAGHAVAALQWRAGRAICEDPLAEPCEWVGASGSAPAGINALGLYAALPVSADSSDPLILHLSAPRKGAAGSLFSAQGQPHFTLVLDHD